MDNNLTPALSVTVEIGDSDIKHGHIAKCRSCPAALAANRATGCFCDTGGVHLIAYDNGHYIENSNLLAGLLPEEARVWIARFDGQRNGLVTDLPGPLSFPIELYPGDRLHQVDRRFPSAGHARRRRGLHGHRADHRGPPRTHRKAAAVAIAGSSGVSVASTGPAPPSPTSTGRRRAREPTT